MKVCNKFKRLLLKNHPEKRETLFGDSSRFVQPPGQMHEEDFESKHGLRRGYSLRRAALKQPASRTSESVGTESELVSEQGSIGTPPQSSEKKQDEQQHAPVISRTPSPAQKGQAQNPLDVDAPWLHIGAGEETAKEGDDIIAESPSGADFNIYDFAYEQEVARIRREQGEAAKVFLTRRVTLPRQAGGF